MNDIEKRVLDYWTVRAHDFGLVRRNEIHSGISGRWGTELDALLPGAACASSMSAPARVILPCCSARRGTALQASTSPLQ